MIGLGADHGGYKLKEEIKKYLDKKNLKYIDYGTYDEERTDYPIYARKVCEAIQKNECDKAILSCRSGIGISMAANKFKGIRCGVGFNAKSAYLGKMDDNINVLAIPGDYVTIEETFEIIDAWLEAEFKGGRYQERIQMIENIEKEFMK